MLTMSVLCETRLQFHSHKLPPVFNKRLFKAQAGIVLTDKLLEILQRPLTERRTIEELHTIKPVVSALKEIHKGFQFIKEALSYVVTYEKVDADVDVCKKWGESCLSCYYILSGSVEAKYAINNGAFGYSERPVDKSKDCEITYTHVAGEYLGLVSGDGQEFDYPPPDNIRTMEASEFLRVDHDQFHRAVRRVQNRYVQEIEDFIEDVAALKALPPDEKNKLVTLMARQEYPAGKVIVNQGDQPEHLFFVAKGRCQYYRSVFIDEVNREELVKLGQIEKGDFFGESNLLDSSPCFCSVASIGPVTCFLVNKWALKTNENIIRILRENRRYFFNDDDIKHYIRDSDIWQSFKRCTITELLEMAGKCHTAVARSEMTSTLSRAVEYGDAKRLSLKMPNHDDEIPGAPKRGEQLFVPSRRSRRRSSAILNCNAAAVVKAVLLLRRKSDTETDSKLSFSFPTKSTSSFQDLTRFNTDEMFKPRSAPDRKSRGGFQKKAISPTIVRRPKTVKIQSTKDALRRPASKITVSRNAKLRQPTFKTMNSNKGVIFGNAGNKNEEIKQISKTKRARKIGRNLKQNRRSESPTGPPREATINIQSKENSSWFLPSVGLEKSVVQKPNVVIKEIINTGIPGRRFSPKTYRRFDRSIFDVLDQRSNQEANSSDEDTATAKSPVLNPWSMSFVASKWMTNVRQRRRDAHALDESDDTGQPPIIVIEDWSPDAESGSEASHDTDASQLIKSRMSSSRKMSRTPTPVLDDVAEESEEEIQKYEDELLPSERWYTPIHEVRDTCEQQLIDFKKEVESLEKQWKSLKRRQKKKKTKNEDAENPEEGEETSTDHKNVDNNETTEKDTVEKTERPTTVKSNRSLKVSLSNTWRSRSKTFSEVPVEQHGIGQQLRRTQSLGRFHLISLSAPNKMSGSKSSLGEHDYAVSQDERRTEKMYGDIELIRVKSSRIERRNLLLRKKIEEIEKHSQNTRHYS